MQQSTEPLLPFRALLKTIRAEFPEKRGLCDRALRNQLNIVWVGRKRLYSMDDLERLRSLNRWLRFCRSYEEWQIQFLKQQEQQNAQNKRATDVRAKNVA